METEKKQVSNRRVVLQKKDKSVFGRGDGKADPSKPNPGIFSRAVRTAIGHDPRPHPPGGAVTPAAATPDPQLEYGTDSDSEGGGVGVGVAGVAARRVAAVANLPHGITDTRLRTLAGNLLQVILAF